MQMDKRRRGHGGSFRQMLSAVSYQLSARNGTLLLMAEVFKLDDRHSNGSLCELSPSSALWLKAESRKLTADPYSSSGSPIIRRYSANWACRSNSSCHCASSNVT
jgi:hypothetical protein